MQGKLEQVIPWTVSTCFLGLGMGCGDWLGDCSVSALAGQAKQDTAMLAPLLWNRLSVLDPRDQRVITHLCNPQTLVKPSVKPGNALI